MKDILTPIYYSIKQNNIKAFNYSKTRGDAVCFNFLEIPDSSYTVVTISVVNNRKKVPSLDFVSFAKFMNEIELKFKKLSEKLCCDCPPNFVPLVEEVNKVWYKMLDCHRLFIIPTEYLFETLESITSDSFEAHLEFKCGIEELSFYVNTNKHNLKLTRFRNKEEL